MTYQPHPTPEPLAEGEVMLAAENAALRRIISECAAAIGNGSGCDPSASLAFMRCIPEEIHAACIHMENTRAPIGYLNPMGLTWLQMGKATPLTPQSANAGDLPVYLGAPPVPAPTATRPAKGQRLGELSSG